MDASLKELISRQGVTETKEKVCLSKNQDTKSGGQQNPDPCGHRCPELAKYLDTAITPQNLASLLWGSINPHIPHYPVI